jgi:ribonuclease Z
MSIDFRVLGVPGGDNAVLVEVDSGQAVERLLFDCGDGCVSELSFADVRSVDHLFFSHLHMDHVGGFDSFFRCNFDRQAKPNQVWGPPETARILQHRFQGFLWNLHGEMSATWLVSDVHPGEDHTFSFELSEAFAVSHDRGTRPYDLAVVEGTGYVVEAFTMDHRTPTLASSARSRGGTSTRPSWRRWGCGRGPG